MSNAVHHVLESPTMTPWWRDESGPRNPFSPNGKTSFTVTSLTDRHIKLLKVVEGRGDFPVDMLRYDHAFCLTPIPHPDHPMFKRTFRVVVGFDHPYEPTRARWESFSWKVLDIEVPARTSRQLRDRLIGWRGKCQRCDQSCGGYAMSYFDLRFLCNICDEQERQHPDFPVAEATLRHALKSGDFTYAGIHSTNLGRAQ